MAIVMYALSLLAGSIIWATVSWWRDLKDKTRPPGPVGLPWIGNALQLKPDHSWLQYTEDAKQYGDVVSYKVFGQPLIVLNSLEAIDTLITKKSAIFSGRPHVPMVSDLSGWEQALAILQPTSQWQVSRKLAHQFIGPQAIGRHHTTLEVGVRDFVATPDKTKFREDFKFLIARTMLQMTYGIIATDANDKYAKNVEEATVIFGLALQPGKFLVDTFLILKYVPAWMPGAEFKRLGAKWKAQVVASVNSPFERVRQDMAAGVNKSSLVGDGLENPMSGSTDEVLKWLSASLYAGSADTTSATMATFLLNMVLHPEVQKKARLEITQVTGNERLPTFADRKDMPFLDAILKETLRIHPIVPMSVPYKTLETCTYKGWLIPKGSIVMANIWNVQRDPERYAHPETFNPDRFIDDPSLLDPHQTFFGFGRRICPGQHLADAALWMSMATILATHEIVRAKDNAGHEITPSSAYTGSTMCEPLPFPYAFTPRPGIADTLFHQNE